MKFSSIARWASVAILAVFCQSAMAAPAPEMNSTKPSVTRPKRTGQTQPTYAVTAGLNGEIFPVFANYASLRPVAQRTWGIVTVKISNNTDETLRQRITVQIPGWSDQEIQLADIPAGESRTLRFAPTFRQRLYQNHEIAAATAAVSVTDATGAVVYASTSPVRMRSADDMYWGHDFQFANYIASWVTPHDDQVGFLLARAKEFMPGRRLPGYESGRSTAEQERMTRLEARAIYRALQQHGVSYVKSSMTLGGGQDVSERVRTPGESLTQSSANCVDGAVMFASLFENLDMQPVVVLLPGHALIGVRMGENSEKYLYVDTALTGRASFEVAVAAADKTLARSRAQDVVRIPIVEARSAGIFPLPVTTAQAVHGSSIQQHRSRISHR